MQSLKIFVSTFSFFLYIAVLAVLDCARFRVKKLQPALIFSLDILPSSKKNPEMKLQVVESEKENNIYNLPLRPAVDKSKIYAGDAARRLIRVFTKGKQKADFVIGSSRPRGMDRDIGFRQADLQIPGWIAVDADADNEGEHFYIQSFLPVPLATPIERKEKKLRKSRASSALEKRFPGRQSRIIQSPSVLLFFHKNGRFLSKIGRDGPGSAPFDLIVSLRTGKRGILYVLHKNKLLSELELLVFRRTKLVQRFRMPKFSIRGASTAGTRSTRNSGYDRKNIFVLEHIQPVFGQGFVIGAAAVRNKKSFNLVERIIYRQNEPAGQPRILLRSSNPIGSLVWTEPKGGFHLLQAGEYDSKVLFKIYNNKGEYRKNQSIKLPKPRSSWRDLFLDIEGRIFFSRVYQGKYSLYEWK